MNPAPSFSLSPDYQRLQALIGAWRDEEEVSADDLRLPHSYTYTVWPLQENEK
ncbi:hypothetical protein ABID19_002241 [Mesorhizobium robiniae]|uniref:Uncharacterized protein n=1 Tax=Mesorhizobium robiniae TaxID=559315 RepID=A0ABV2GLN8_9HYPH